MLIDFNHLTRTSVTTLCQQAHVPPPHHPHPLQLFVSALHARARLDNKIPLTRVAKPRQPSTVIDIKKLQAGDHDD